MFRRYRRARRKERRTAGGLAQIGRGEMGGGQREAAAVGFAQSLEAARGSVLPRGGVADTGHGETGFADDSPIGGGVFQWRNGSMICRRIDLYGDQERDACGPTEIT